MVEERVKEGGRVFFPGCRPIYTAHKCGNEAEVSRGMKESGINRAEVFDAFDKDFYKHHNATERMFGRPKEFRCIAMCYDKKAENSMAALCRAAIICY